MRLRAEFISCLLYDGFKYDLYLMDEKYQESGDTRFGDERFDVYDLNCKRIQKQITLFR